MVPLRFFFLLIGLLSAFQSLNAQCIVINEVVVNPADACDGSCQPNTAEWTELYNNCNVPVDISCFVLADGDWAVTIPNGTVLNPGEYYVIGSSNSDAPIDLNIGTCNCTSGAASQIGVFTNSAEQIALIDPDGNFVDAIYWGAGQFSSNPFSVAAVAGCSGQSVVLNQAATDWIQVASALSSDGASIARDCDGSSAWITSTSGYTPGASNNGTPPVADFSASSTSICTGDCIDFFYNGIGSPDSFSWNFDGSDTPNSSLGDPSGICYNTQGTFQVSLEVSNNCGTDILITAAYITVSASEVPVISSSDNTTLCEGESAVLEASGTGPWQWMADGSALVGQTTNQLVVNATGSYTVVFPSALCSSESEPWDVLVLDLPEPVITYAGDAVACQGEAIFLQAPIGMASYEWRRNGVVLPSTTSSLEVTLDGSYEVTIFLDACTATSMPVQISVVPTPEVFLTLNGSGVICPGLSSELQASPGFDSYTWLLNDAPVSVTVNNVYNATTGGVYRVEALDPNGCSAVSNSIEVVLELPEPPQISLDGDAAVCPGETLQLTATGDFVQWQWWQGTVPVVGATGNTIEAFGDAQWSVVGTNDQGCTVSSAVLYIEEWPQPEVVLSAQGNVTTCDEDYLLLATSNVAIASWQWLINGTAVDDNNESEYSVTEDGWVEVMVTSVNGCSGISDEVSISFVEEIVVTLEASDTLPCVGDLVLLSTPLSYPLVVWNDGSSGASLAVTQSGIFHIQATDANGCSGRDSIEIVFQVPPEIDLPEVVNSDCSNGAVLNPQTDASFHFWTPVLGLSSDTGATVIANPTRTTVYTLSAISGNCTVSASVRVEVDCGSVFVPNAFTPNGDGINDYFQAVVSGVEDFEIVVFNRWGDVVYRSIDPTEKWTGGKVEYFVPDGVYTYRIKALDENGVPVLPEAETAGYLVITR